MHLYGDKIFLIEVLLEKKDFTFKISTLDILASGIR